MEETTIQAIPITAQEAFRRSELIASLDKQIAEARYQAEDVQSSMDAYKAGVLKELEHTAATNDPEKKLSNADKRKVALDEHLAKDDQFQLLAKTLALTKLTLDQLIIEHAHQTRVWRTIRAFAHTSNGHGGEDHD